MRIFRSPAAVIAMIAFLAGAAFPALAGPRAAQTTSQAPPHPLKIPDKFTNLKVLPPDISREHLLAVMDGFAGQLGVHCSWCHVLNGPAHTADFASDAKPEKRAARVMMRMSSAIDSRYLTEIPMSLQGKATVTCYTCHRGQPIPPKQGASSSLPATAGASIAGSHRKEPS